MLDLPVIEDERGKLTFVEARQHAPFDIRRVYYLYGAERTVSRGGHAHKVLEQLLIALHGEFSVLLDDGATREQYRLNSPAKGLYVPAMCWREIENFRPDAICLVLASEHFDEGDYLRNYQDFLAAARNAR